MQACRHTARPIWGTALAAASLGGGLGAVTAPSDPGSFDELVGTSYVATGVLIGAGGGTLIGITISVRRWVGVHFRRETLTGRSPSAREPIFPSHF